MTPHAIRIAFLLSAALLPLGSARAVDEPDLTEGFTPPEITAGGLLGGFPMSGFDSVNPYSGQLAISIPLRSIAGRGALSHTVAVSISQNWHINAHNSCPAWNPNCSTPTAY